MTKKGRTIRLGPAETLSIEWAYQFPDEGWIGRVRRDGLAMSYSSETMRTGFHLTQEECVAEIREMLEARKTELEREAGEIEESIKKLEEK